MRSSRPAWILLPTRRIAALTLGLLIALAPRGQELLVTPDPAQGVCTPGEPMRWHLEVKGAAPAEAAFVVKKNGMAEIAKGVIPLSAGRGIVETALNEPGWVLLEVSLKGTNGQPIKATGGALVAPGQIRPSAPPPADFDAFWQAKLKELASVPMSPELVRADAGKPGVDYFKVTLDNIRGTHIRGQLARPAEGARFPALLIVQWAGVYGLQKAWATDRAAEGWLVFNVNAHDLPIDEPDAFYQAQAAGPLRDYPSIGNDDRETSYFLRMYLSCFRGAEYLSERPDWDGRTLVVTGGSQGGLQAILTAALHPKVTAAMASVPAGCDLNGPEASRLPGWPMWYWNTKDKNETQVRATARYFDVVNFAPKVKCPVLVGVGLIDTVCPPPGVLAAYNLLSGPKELVVLPLGEHGDKNGTHAAYYTRTGAWSHALVRGEPAPLP